MLYRRTDTTSGLLKVLLPPQSSELGTVGGARDEGGGHAVPASLSAIGPPGQQSSRLLGGGTHRQKTSMATKPASRMAKRMVRMEVRATMPALCPLPVTGMLLGGLARERVGGEGAGRTPRGSAGSLWARGQSWCHHTGPPRNPSSALPQFPQLLTGALHPKPLVLSVQHPPGTTPCPPAPSG